MTIVVRCSFFGAILVAFLPGDVMGQYDSCSESYQDESSTAVTCPMDDPEAWLVSDTASAASLAEAVKCSNGTFNVTWRGRVLVNHTICILNGTNLYVNGEGSGAEVDGGGKTRLFMAVDANLHIDSLTLSNGNASYGGAIAAMHSGVFLNQTTCSGNIASSHGGAIYMGVNSTVLLSGPTKFSFNSVIGNDGMGGAVYVGNHSQVSWGGATSFVNNTAQYGGAVSVEWDSIASWDGRTFFVNNTAEYGGGLNVYNSSVSWDGKTSLFNNTAKYGGAMYVHDNSIISWTGETSFTANHAISCGGAIYHSTSSSIIVARDTYFLENEAGIDGGAAYVHVNYDDSNSSYFIVVNNPTVRFEGNICGANGGAIAFIGGVITRFPSSMTFWGNTAGVAGGAIYMSGVIFGIRFEGMKFISNSALIGGGLYSTGSGTAIIEDTSDILERNPTTFIGCEFIGNEATKTGGAMDSGAGRDMILNTSFVRNTASIGGALRLVGTTSLFGCEFVENLSGDDVGPAVSNDGAITNLSRCSFVDNVFNCPTGFFLEYNNTGALFDTACKGCDIQCSGCTVEGKEPMCLEELDHSSSAGGNTTLESLLIERGHWRATNKSIAIVACYNAAACLGGLTGEQGYCGEGYEGPYCSVCSKGYTASFGFACNKCSENAAGGIALAVIVIAVFSFTFVAFVSYMLSGETEDNDRGIVARLTRFIPLQSVKIVIVVWQILTQFSTVANVAFLGIYQRFLDGVDILNFDLSWVISVGCIIDTDFHDQLLLATLGPLVCMPILGGTFVAAMRRTSVSEETGGIVRRKHVSMMLLLTFLVYSSVSSTLFKTFACDKLDDGKNYLRADYRIECDSSKHKALNIYAGFMVVLYVIGIPAFYGILLYNNQKALTKNAGREEDESIKPINDLWKPYRPNRFYDEVIECVRRVMLTGALVFIYPKTAAQIAVALMMATFFIFVSEALAPHASPWDRWCSRTGHAIVYTSMFFALLLKVDVSGERASSQRVFEYVLISAHSCLILVIVVEALTMVVAWKKEVNEDAKPRIRRSATVSPPGVRNNGRFLEEDEASLSPEKYVFPNGEDLGKVFSKSGSDSELDHYYPGGN